MKKFLLSGALIVASVALFAILSLKIPYVSKKLDGPKFCGTCHIMDPWVETYLQSSHSQYTTCGGCHIPHDIVPGAFYKTFTGTRDGIYMIIGKIPQRFHITNHGSKVVNDNCLQCHEGVMETVGYPLAERNQDCFDCHRDLPHNRRELQKEDNPNEKL